VKLRIVDLTLEETVAVITMNNGENRQNPAFPATNDPANIFLKLMPRNPEFREQ
jgi:hypothetical protein